MKGQGGQRHGDPMAREGATTPNNPVSLLRRFQRAFTARLATHSNVGSPSSRLRTPNSTRREPAPAVHVSLLLSGGTPVFRFTWGQEETKDSWQNSGTRRARRQGYSYYTQLRNHLSWPPPTVHRPPDEQGSFKDTN